MATTGDDASADGAATKATWRRRALANRIGLRPDDQRICWHLERFLRSAVPQGWVVTFSPMPGEVDLTPLQAVTPPITTFALTRTPGAGRTLSLHPADAPTEQHRFGFRQPIEQAPVVPDDEVVAVLVPGLAFDHRGHRLGFGAGFYDRLLARLGPDVLRVGVSDGFLVSELPVEPHDMPMTHLASEVGVVATPLRSAASS